MLQGWNGPSWNIEAAVADADIEAGAYNRPVVDWVERLRMGLQTKAGMKGNGRTKNCVLTWRNRGR